MKSLFDLISIRGKLLLGYGFAFIFTIIIASAALHYMVRQTIETLIEDELRSSTSSIYTMLKASTDITIKNHLRGIAQRNKEIVEYYYRRYLEGELTEETAKHNVRRILLSQQVGKTGYIYCVDSAGVAVVHGAPGVEGIDFSHRSFVQEQVLRKEGYLSYDWQNPGEPEPRPKALYMTYFEPWDWIISVSSYREEFIDLVNVDDFRESILGLRFGKTGYSYVLDGKGNIIIHPSYAGSIYDIDDDDLQATAARIVARKTGKIVYDWRNPGEDLLRKKIVMLNYIPELDWIIASSGYMDEFHGALLHVQNVIFVITVIAMAVVLLMTLWIGSAITSPLRRLMKHFSTGATGDFSVRMDDSARDEFGMLARYFNSFMETLQQFSGSLQEEVLEHRMSLEALRESEERFRLLAENSPDIIISLDQKGYISYVNPVVEKVLGYSPHELAGKSFLVMAREQEAGEYTRQFRKVRNGETLVDYIGVLVHKNGSVRHFIFCGAPATDSQGNMMGIEGFLKDITERRNLEFQLQQVQKLEAVGTLAGGVAHDFNNILTAIRGSLDISLLMVGQNDPILKNLQQIEKAVTRASDLTRQLLFFSRRQPVEMAPLNLNQSVDNILRIIERLIGENIAITVDLAPDLQPVMADGGNIEQVIMNLMINSRDAMPEGGAITIRTRNATVGDDYVRVHSYARHGKFVCLSMEDTGIGMDGETVKHIFEPFFTTKEQGKGTGLGLAVVYGIVKKHKGWIVADSRPGEGTVFSVFFPVSEEEPGKVPGDDARAPRDSRGSGEKILVIEDDSSVLAFAGTVLKANGYTVLTAASAMEARVMFHEHQDSLDLIFSDVVLPDKNGLDLVHEFESEKPDIQVLMTSGYMDENSLSRIIRDNNHRFLPKPYVMKDLLETVRILLDGSGRA